MCAQCQIATGRCLCVPLSPHPQHLSSLVFGNFKHLKNTQNSTNLQSNFSQQTYYRSNCQNIATQKYIRLKRRIHYLELRKSSDYEH